MSMDEGKIQDSVTVLKALKDTSNHHDASKDKIEEILRILKSEHISFTEESNNDLTLRSADFLLSRSKTSGSFSSSPITHASDTSENAEKKSLRDLKGGTLVENNEVDLFVQEVFEKPKMDASPLCNLRGPIRAELKRNISRAKNGDFVINEKIEIIGSGHYNEQIVFATMMPFMTKDAPSRHESVTAKTRQTLTIGENVIVIVSNSRFAPPPESPEMLHFEVEAPDESKAEIVENDHEFEEMMKTEMILSDGDGSSNEQKAVHNLIGPVSVHCHQKVHSQPSSKLFQIFETTEIRTNENKNEPTEEMGIENASNKSDERPESLPCRCLLRMSTGENVIVIVRGIRFRNDDQAEAQKQFALEELFRFTMSEKQIVSQNRESGALISESLPECKTQKNFSNEKVYAASGKRTANLPVCDIAGPLQVNITERYLRKNSGRVTAQQIITIFGRKGIQEFKTLATLTPIISYSQTRKDTELLPTTTPVIFVGDGFIQIRICRCFKTLDSPSLNEEKTICDLDDAMLLKIDKNKAMSIQTARITAGSAEKYALVGPVDIKLRQRVRHRTTQAYILCEVLELRSADAHSKANKELEAINRQSSDSASRTNPLQVEEKIFVGQNVLRIVRNTEVTTSTFIGQSLEIIECRRHLLGSSRKKRQHDDIRHEQNEVVAISRTQEDDGFGEVHTSIEQMQKAGQIVIKTVDEHNLKMNLTIDVCSHEWVDFAQQQKSHDEIQISKSISNQRYTLV